MKRKYLLSFIACMTCMLLCNRTVFAQMPPANPAQPNTLFGNTPPRDTTANKTNTSQWKNAKASMYYKMLNSTNTYTPDTNIHTFHRQPFSQPWNRNTGNIGAPAQSLVFTPEYRVGPTLGYHVYDAYRTLPDSLKFYNTTRPYSDFSFLLGSKREQRVSIMFTQNIKHNWNFAVGYRKIVSPGFYKAERNNHDALYLTTNYQSRNLHYELNGGVIYNKMQHDENGGIVSDTQLTSNLYGDRQTVSVRFPNDNYSATRSTVSNVQRDFTILLQHSYTFGRTDTTYNEDSTKYAINLVPRFRITHRMDVSNERHTYKDILPDSLRYTGFFERSFPASPLGVDSVFSQQNWFKVDNRFLLNGILGKEGKELTINAGVGNRIDRFNTNYITGEDVNNMVSNYLIGEAKKEITEPGQWFYSANAQLYVTGGSAGDFLVQAELGKDIDKVGIFSGGFKQQLQSAPYSYTFYGNQYLQLPASFGKETVTQLYGTLQSKRLNVAAGVRNYLIGNYMYMSDTLRMVQDASPFNLTQVWVRKLFRYRIFIFDNELVYQQVAGTAPINVPALLGRHQLGIEGRFFKGNLRVSSGLEVRYHTGYKPSGYDPFFNRFYYQTAYSLNTQPEATLYFNFRIKAFRASLSYDQLQGLFMPTVINYPGYPNTEGVIRFSFSWVMIN